MSWGSSCLKLGRGGVFGSAPATHAAARADGSTVLLTTKEFEALDRSVFVPLSDIVAE